MNYLDQIDDESYEIFINDAGTLPYPSRENANSGNVLSGTPYTSTLRDGIPDTWRAENMPVGAKHNDNDPVTGRNWIRVFLDTINTQPVVTPPVATGSKTEKLNFAVL